MTTPFVAPLVLAAAEGGGGGLLSIDNTLLWATLVIFALFAFVLGKFAWGPLLKIVDEREKSIRDQVDSAERSAAEARQLLQQHQELVRNAGRERDELLAKTAKEAETIRQELIARARSESEQVVARAREQIQREKDQAISELRTQVADIAVEAAARIVKSSLDEATQRRLVDEYVESLPRVQ